MTITDIKHILNPKVNSLPSDDFRIIDSWTEYDEKSSKSVNERKLNFMCYEIEVINPVTGDKTHLFKAIKFCRIRRLPKDAKQSKSFMDMHTQILSGVYEQEINLITIIANIIEPTPIGLLFLYGVQGVGKDIEEAKKKATDDYLGLTGMLQATYRVMELSHIIAEESEWLRSKMYDMENVTVVRGIPKAHNEGVAISKSSGLSGSPQNPEGQGTLEELITGMADYEYVVQILSTPVYTETLKSWSLKTEQDMTDWYEQMQGSKSLSLNLSIPMMYMANQSSSNGWSQAYTDADSVSYSQGESFNVGYGESQGQALSHSFGTSDSESHSISNSTSFSESNSVSHSVSNSVSDSFSSGTSEGHSVGESLSNSTGTSTGHSIGNSMGISNSESLSNSISHSNGESFGNSHSISSSNSESFGDSYGESTNHSQGISHNTGTSSSESITDSTSNSKTSSISNGTSSSVSNTTSNGYSNGQSINETQSVNHSTSHSDTNSTSSSWSEGTSIGSSQGYSIGESKGNSTSIGNSITNSLGNSNSNGTSGNIGAFGASIGASYSSGTSESNSQGTTQSSGDTYNQSIGANLGSSNSNSTSNGGGTSVGESNGYSDGVGYSRGTGSSFSTNHSEGVSTSNGLSSSESYGISAGTSHGTSTSTGVSISNGTSSSNGWGISTSNSHTSGTSTGASDGTSSSTSISDGYSAGTGSSSGTSQSQSLSDSTSLSLSSGNGTSVSDSTSVSNTHSTGTSSGVSDGYSTGTSKGTSTGTSDGISHGTSTSDGETNSTGTSKSTSTGTSKSNGTSKSLGESIGTSGGISTGGGTSMGLGPSIGYSKSYQWLDQQVKDIVELLEFQNERIKKALRGNGAFYTYVYIACPNTEALAVAKSVAKSTWQNDFALTNPIQILNLEEEEQKHLLYHFCAFSSDVTRENVAGVQEYKYATILLPGEIVAYTHPPRISEGGIYADVDDIPKFAVPSMLKGEIYMGTILSAERYTMKNGYKTQHDYRIDESELMHGIFTGASRSGKTVAAMRFIAELANAKRKKTGKRLRIVCMDPKSDWRTLARFVEPERFKFFSLGNINFHPINFNPCKIPRGVYPQVWIDGLIDIYCRAYGLLERGKQMMGETIYALYDEAGVFEACDSPDWIDKVPELSKVVTFPKIYQRMTKIKVDLEDPNNKKGKAGNDTRDAYARLLDRLQAFGRDYSIERKLFGNDDGLGIDDLIGNDDVVVLESAGLESTFSNFIFGIITSGFYKYAKANEGGFLAENQYETVLVIEEANKVLTGNDTCGTGGGGSIGMSGQSEFEEILDQSAGYGLFVFAITQKVADMPSSIIANAGMIFAGRLTRPDDVSTVVRMIAREERIDDRNLVKWFPRSPIGWFICKSGRNFDFKSSEPILVQISRLNISPPSNDEIDEIFVQKEIEKLTS